MKIWVLEKSKRIFRDQGTFTLIFSYSHNVWNTWDHNFGLLWFSKSVVTLEKQMIPQYKAQAVASKISQVQLCSSIRDYHATFLVKNTLFKEEVAWQPLRKLQSCSPSILIPPSKAFIWGIVCLSTIIGCGEIRVMSKSVNFHYIKSTLFDITLDFSTMDDGRKTNSTSFKCPTRWLQNTRRTAM